MHQMVNTVVVGKDQPSNYYYSADMINIVVDTKRSSNKLNI